MNYKVVILASAEQDLNELKNHVVRHFSLDVWKVTYAELKESTAT